MEKKGINILIGVLIVIIVLLLMVCTYFIFIKKDETSDPMPSDNQINTETSLEGVTFKTNDGTKVLKIVSKDDSEALNKAKTATVEDSKYPREYFGYYNNTKLFQISTSNDLGQDLTNSKYKVLGGEEVGKNSQCRDTHQFIVNTLDNTLVNLNYIDNYGYGYYYIIHKVKDNYYFSEKKGGCILGSLSGAVYNESLKKMGDYFFDGDDNGNIYVLDNGSIVKYDKNGNTIRRTNTGYILRNINNNVIVYDDTLYIITYIDSEMYLVDTMANQKYKLIGLENFVTFERVYLLKADGKIISVLSLSYIDEVEKIVYTFDTSTKTLTKK